MRNLTILSLSLFIISNLNLQAQNSDKYFETVDKVERFAKKGVGSGEVKPLLKAVRLLIDHPEVRPLNFHHPLNKDKNKDFFNPFSLIKLAKRFAGMDEKDLERIQRLEKELAEELERLYTEMAIEEGRIRIPGATNIFLLGKGTDEVRFLSKTTQEIFIRFKEGARIGMEVLSNSDEQLIRQNKSSDTIKLISFVAKAGEEFRLVMNNDYQEPLDCNLAIFTQKVEVDAK